MKMDRCDQIEDCSFFNVAMVEMPTVAEMMKQRYCHGDFESCARKIVFASLGTGKTPVSLAPNDHQRAREIIDAER